MNSLEFIDREIEQNKILFERYTNHLLAFPSSIIENRREEIRDELTLLQQIKSELEAWYSVKKGLKIKEGKVDYDSFYEYLEFEDELFDENQYEYAYLNLKPIKKALEVKENDNSKNKTC